MSDRDVIWSFTREARIAYFSMEIALAPEIPTYSGGLLYDRHVPRWRHEPEMLIRAECCLTDDAVWDAHSQAKANLLAEIEKLGVKLDPARPILSFARRMTAYKRPDLLFADLKRLRALARQWPFQQVLAVMKGAITRNASYFNSHRMMRGVRG